MQHAPLDGGEERVQAPADQAGRDDQRVHDVHGAALAGDVDLAPEPGGPDDQLGRDGEDQRRRRGDPQPRRDIGHGAHQRHAQHAVVAPDPERAGGLQRHRVEVPRAIDGLDQQRPRRRERDQEDLALQPRPVQEDRERDQRHGRNRPEELDHRPERVVGDLAEAEQQPERHRDRDRDAEADRPALHRVQDRGPVGALAELPNQRRAGLGHRREVAAGEEPAADDELDQHQHAEDAQPRLRRAGHAQSRRFSCRKVLDRHV